MTLPENWQFLGPWWWVLHVIAIALIFYIGYAIGKSTHEEFPNQKSEDSEKKDEW